MQQSGLYNIYHSMHSQEYVMYSIAFRMQRSGVEHIAQKTRSGICNIEPSAGQWETKIPLLRQSMGGNKSRGSKSLVVSGWKK